MKIKIGFDIEFELPGPTPMILMLYVHPSRQRNLLAEEKIVVEPDVPLTDFTDLYGNRCARIFAPAGNLRLALETMIEDSGEPDAQAPEAPQANIQDLPDDVLPFLLTSRYCEVDKLSDTAWQLFGSTEPGWPRAQAICDWVHKHITFNYQHADPTKSAYDVYQDGRGVCRDFSHLAVAFFRCMNIPARYVTVFVCRRSEHRCTCSRPQSDKPSNSRRHHSSCRRRIARRHWQPRHRRRLPCRRSANRRS